MKTFFLSALIAFSTTYSDKAAARPFACPSEISCDIYNAACERKFGAGSTSTGMCSRGLFGGLSTYCQGGGAVLILLEVDFTNKPSTHQFLSIDPNLQRFNEIVYDEDGIPYQVTIERIEGDNAYEEIDSRPVEGIGKLEVSEE
jgi:hypothetical protein